MLGITPSLLFIRIITLMIAFTVHEFAHAWTANMFGDDTPRMNGRLTLNPFAHLDIMGTLLLLFAGFGWAKPVPVNPYALRRHSRSALMWVSLAGPFSNLLLAAVAAVPLRFGWVPFTYGQSAFIPTPFEFLFDFLSINLMLMLFNLIPISPLDGEAILEYLLPPSWSDKLAIIKPYGFIILLLIFFVLPMLGIDLIGWVLTPLQTALLRLLIGI